MQTKALTQDTQRVVTDLRLYQDALQRLYGPSPLASVLGHAISRLSFLDTDREQLSAWLQESRTECEQLKKSRRRGRPAQAGAPTPSPQAEKESSR